MANRFFNHGMRITLPSNVEPPFTFAAFFNCPTGASSNRAIISLQQIAVGPRGTIRTSLQPDCGPSNPLRLTISDNNGDSGSIATVSSTQFNLGQWHHACGVISSGSSRTVYLDGGNTGTTTTTNNAYYDTVTVGALQQVSGTQVLAAEKQIAELAVWTKVLSSAEVVALSKGISPNLIARSDLLLYYPLIRNFAELCLGGTYTVNNGGGTGSLTVENHPRVYR